MAPQVARVTDRNLELLAAPDRARSAEAGWRQRAFSDAVNDLKRWRGLFANGRVRLVIENPLAIPNPAKAYAALLLMGGRAEIVSPDGRISKVIGPGDVLRAAIASLNSGRLVDRAIAECDKFLEYAPVRAPGFAPAQAPPFVLRTNLWFGAKVGGAYSHAAGIVNAIDEAFGAVTLATTDQIPLLRPDIDVRRIDLGRIEGWDRGVGVHFTANRALYAQAQHWCPSPPAFVYQRSGLGDLSGLRLARLRKRPLVLEYNGPEVWVAKQWGAGIAHAEEFERIETALLRRADLVMAVSRALVDDAISRGAPKDRVLLSPNGVDCARFGPHVDGAKIAKALGLGGRITALLLSSFGPWHGADIAIAAFAEMLRDSPDMRDRAMLVLAGDGDGRLAARLQAAQAGLIEGETVLFPGMIPAERAPELLAACDIMLSPTKPNADGSPFFGSPTKIFEYMAAGRPIIASNIDQIGEVLSDEHTALLVTPGDAESLAGKMARAFARPADLAVIADNARAEAEERHSWIARIMALKQRLHELDLLPA